MKVTVIGLGGIGSHLCRLVARFLVGVEGEHTLTLVDGDHYTMDNRGRQEFERIGNKASETARQLAALFPELTINAVAEYLTPENCDFILLEDEIVLVCVDNHATRKLISDGAGARSSITIISGGNTYLEGDVFIYARKDGVDLTPSLTAVDPAIASPKDKAPYEMGCEELAHAGEPQLVFTNFMVASMMGNAFHRCVKDPGFLTEMQVSGTTSMSTRYSRVCGTIVWNRTMSGGSPGTSKEVIS